MNNHPGLVLVVLAGAISCGKQHATSTQASVTPTDPAVLLAADGQWRDGLLHKDTVALDRIVAPEYTLTTAVGVVPRPAWMASAAIWQTKALEWRGAPHVDVYGDAGVVRGTLHWNVVKDKPDPRTGSAELDLDFLVTDVWILRAGQWQVVARHSTIPLSH